MFQHAHDSGCLESKIEGIHGRSDNLPPVKGWRYIDQCEGLQDHKKARHLFEPGVQQGSDGAIYFGNRLGRSVYSCLQVAYECYGKLFSLPALCIRKQDVLVVEFL